MDPQTAALTLIFVTSVSSAIILMAPLIVFYRRVDELNPNPVGRLFGPFTSLVGALLPPTRSGRESIRKVLLLAGHYRPTAQDDYFALRSVLTLTPVILCWVLALLTESRFSVAFFVVGFVLGALGFSITRVLLQYQGSQREDEIRRGLPMFMDTLGLVLSAGATLPVGMRRAADAVQRGYPELTREVRLVVAHAELRSMSHALEQWRGRLPIPELGSLVFLLSQGDRLGTDISRGLWELSASLQTSARQRAEAAANRANFFMLFPTVLCLMLAAGIVLIGPGAVLLDEGLTEFGRAVEDANRRQKDAARPPRVGPRTPPPAPTPPQAP